MKALKIFLKIIAVLIIAFVLFVLYAQLSDYKPDVTEEIYTGESTDTIFTNKAYTIFNWNIGYGGLGDDMDFFYDGGEMVRSTKERVHENVNEIVNVLLQNDSADFYLLQEVDVKSKRSFKVNEYEIFNQKLENYHAYMGTNYKVTFVPIPPSQPLGKVNSGIASYSKYLPLSVVRYQFPGNYSWPMSLFMLDRCFLVKRYPTANGKQFILVNTHNSAYDDGTLKQQQMEYMKKFLTDEYALGNYVIVGGDWNQNPPNYEETDKALKRGVMNNIDSDYLPEWQWVFNPEFPTNRYLDEVYVKGKTNTTVIDFFLMSPNIKVNVIKNINLEFKNSDHQPVITNIELI